MNNHFKLLIPFSVGMFGAVFLGAVYFGIVSWTKPQQTCPGIHSVDSNVDLALLSNLITDAGIYISPIKRGAPLSRHQITGILSLPGSIDGKSILNGVQTLTLN